PAVLFSLYTRIDAAISGQKAASELTGRPGARCSLVTAPINQDGIESAKTSKKNVSGALLLDAMASEEPSEGPCSALMRPALLDTTRNTGNCADTRSNSESGASL